VNLKKSVFKSFDELCKVHGENLKMFIETVKKEELSSEDILKWLDLYADDLMNRNTDG